MRTRNFYFLVIKRWNDVSTSIYFDNPDLKRWSYACRERRFKSLFFNLSLNASTLVILQKNVRHSLQRKTILQHQTIFYSVTLSIFLLAWRTFSILVIYLSRVLPTLLIMGSPNTYRISHHNLLSQIISVTTGVCTHQIPLQYIIHNISSRDVANHLRSIQQLLKMFNFFHRRQ